MVITVVVTAGATVTVTGLSTAELLVLAFKPHGRLQITIMIICAHTFESPDNSPTGTTMTAFPSIIPWTRFAVIAGTVVAGGQLRVRHRISCAAV